MGRIKKAIISLALMLMSIGLFAQTFISDGMMIKKSGGEDVTIERTTVISIDKGVIRVFHSSEDNDYSNLLVTGDVVDGDDGSNIESYYVTCIDKECTNITFSWAYYKAEDKWVIGLFSDEYDVYYRGYFEE